MADDDLSLDFTLPGTAVPPPAPVPEPVPEAAPAPVGVSEPPPAPMPPVPPKPALPAALVEAAELHARGEDIEASRRLETALKQGEARGACEERTWLALFQMLQLLERKPAYEALALAFARRFEKSPPAWRAPAAGAGIGLSTGGRAHVGLEGCLDASAGEPLKQLMKLAQGNSSVRLDLGKLTDVADDGCTLTLRALTALKKARRECVFGRPEPLIALLQGRLAVGERTHEPMWQLLLELLQKTFDQAAFEEAAVNYAVTFEVSPPSWEGPPAGQEPAKAAAKGEGFALEGQLIGCGEAEFAGIARLSGDEGGIVVDASRLVRIDAASAAALKAVLQEQAAAGRRIILGGLAQLAAVFLEHGGCGDFAELRLRKD